MVVAVVVETAAAMVVVEVVMAALVEQAGGTDTRLQERSLRLISGGVRRLQPTT